MSGAPGSRRKVQVATIERPEGRPSCCPHFHAAVELVGKRWTGAILYVLMHVDRPLRFSEIAHAVPDLSDRLLSERMRELEARGLVTRTELEVGVEYALTEMGRDLDAAVTELRAWARRWLAQ
jgi:DNA-binding HxlR family transcriptional regulator